MCFHGHSSAYKRQVSTWLQHLGVNDECWESFFALFFSSSKTVKSKSFTVAGASVSKHLLSTQLRFQREGARCLQSSPGVPDRLCPQAAALPVGVTGTGGWLTHRACIL